MKFKVAIIGTGNIGTDLLMKLLKIEDIEVVAFVGRRDPSKPIPEGVLYSKDGIEFFIKNPNCCHLVFDCTDAYTAISHSQIFSKQGIIVIDLTPSQVGKMFVPYVNCQKLINETNINMVTCGGQVSIPILYYISKKTKVEYAEVVTQISANSAGMATRENIDKYIETTENAIKQLTNVKNCKVILTLNPSEMASMQTSIYMKATRADFEDFDEFTEKIKEYVPNYKISLRPTYLSNGICMVSMNIIGSGDFLSKYAGNLDVINCAAIYAVKLFKQNYRYSRPLLGNALGVWT